MATTKKNIIVGAAALFLGEALVDTSDPNTPITQTGTDPSIVAGWRPEFVANESFRTTLNNDDGTNTFGNWREAGYTQEGIEVAYEPDFGEVEVDQLLDAAKIFKQGMTVSVNTTLAEATLENLLVAWGQDDSTLTVGDGTVTDEAGDTMPTGESEATVEGGSLGENPIERGLIFVGNAVEHDTSSQYKERVYSVYRALSVESSTHALRRNEATVFPVSFRLLSEDSAGRYGTVRDRLLA